MCPLECGAACCLKQPVGTKALPNLKLALEHIAAICGLRGALYPPEACFGLCRDAWDPRPASQMRSNCFMILFMTLACQFDTFLNLCQLCMLAGAAFLGNPFAPFRGTPPSRVADHPYQWSGQDDRAQFHPAACAMLAACTLRQLPQAHRQPAARRTAHAAVRGAVRAAPRPLRQHAPEVGSVFPGPSMRHGLPGARAPLPAKNTTCAPT